MTPESVVLYRSKPLQVEYTHQKPEVRVTRAFLADFEYLASRYGWTPTDIEEVKAHTREHFDLMSRYWSTLAAAHRAGYEQTRENGYIRLSAWCEKQGWPNLTLTLQGDA